MHGADYLIAGVLVASIIIGALRGFLRESVALLAWLIGLWLAWHFAGRLAPSLGGKLAEPDVGLWAARIVILAAVLILGAWIGALVAYLARRAAGLAATDRLLGVVFGFFRGAVIVGLGALLAASLELDREPWFAKAKLTPYATAVGNWLDVFAAPKLEPLVDEALEPVRT